MRLRTLLVFIGAVGSYASSSVAQGQSEPLRATSAVRQDISAPLSDLVLRAPRAARVANRVRRDRVPFRGMVAGPELDRDPLVDLANAPVTSQGPTPLPSLSFDGTSDDDNAAVTGGRTVPPDTNGDVGPNHYVQMNNVVFEVFDKNGGSLLGPASNQSLWVGFGGICETNNDGDPLVVYDHLADRWVLSQFANPPTDDEGHQCFAVSTTPDPTGTYHRYDFIVSPGKFNDYPKIGVWPDAYYLSIREFGATDRMTAVAVERAQMLVGGTARILGPASAGNLGSGDGLLPSHLEGPPPPPGTPNTFVRATNGSPDRYELWDFFVDWNNTSNSSFTQLTSIPTTSFDPSVFFVPSLGESLEVLAEFTMYRAQQRVFAGYRSIVMNHTVDVGGNQAGIRWAELRNSGTGWTQHQAGTMAPDSDHRWMGSIAQDKDGNIALGYSVSSATTHPSIRYVSRMAGDPLGTMPGGEVVLHAGAGSQIGSSNRWGDYSSMSTDPNEDCTFWYTQEYYANTASFDFKTRIGSFQFPCSAGISNDLFANRTPISGTSGSAAGNNTAATGEAGEPDHAGSSTPLASLWWEWVAPASGSVSFDTFGSSFDTTLAAYTGGAVSGLTEVASNDDTGGTQSQIVFSVTGGTSYKIAVDGFASETGSVALNWTLTASAGCTVSLTPTFAGTQLTLTHDLETSEAVAWYLYAILDNRTIRVWERTLTPGPPTTEVDIFNIPSLGNLGILTVLTTPTAGIVCSDFETVFTGTPGGLNPVVSEEVLEKLLEKAQRNAPRQN